MKACPIQHRVCQSDPARQSTATSTLSPNRSLNASAALNLINELSKVHRVAAMDHSFKATDREISIGRSRRGKEGTQLDQHPMEIIIILS